MGIGRAGFRNGLAAAICGLSALVLTSPGAAAQGLPPQQVLNLDRTQCLEILGPGGAGKSSLLCCLHQLDVKYGGGTDLTPAERNALADIRAGAIARLAALGAPDQPRFCPADPPTSWGIIWPPPPPQPQPRQVGNPPRGLPPGGPPGGFASLPRVTLSFGLGTLLTERATDVPTGGGTSQRFPSDPFSGAGLDLRLAWILSRAATNRDPLLRRASNTVLSMFVGYTYLRSQVTEFTNIGGIFDGITNTAFRGHTTVRRPYVGLGMAMPLNEGNPGSMPPLSLHAAGTLGYSWIGVTDDNGPFSNTEQGLDAGLELGLNMRVNDRWTVTPTVSAVVGEHREDPEVMFILRSTFRF